MEQLELTIHDPVDTLEKARTSLLRDINQGTVCPCCDRYAKIYKRKLTSSMAYALILIYGYFKLANPTQWLHVEDHLKRIPGIPSSIRGDFAKLVHWGLLEASGENGYYRITDWGRVFVEGEHFAARYVFIYNGVIMKFSEEETTIQEALGDRFSYAELMKGNDQTQSGGRI